MQNVREEHAIVLDFLPNGYPLENTSSYKKTPIIQALGTTNFILLELVPKKEAKVKSGDTVYIGSGKRDHIHHINGKIPVSKLTNTALGELDFVLKNLISQNQERFIDFFNNSGPLSMRMHQLELLPGLGKKHMWEVLEARRDKPFESFQDIKTRVKLLPNPEILILRRIKKELDGEEKHNLFVRD